MSDNNEQVMRMALSALGVATTPLTKDRQEVLRAMDALRAALAAQAGQHQANWYCIEKLGMATLCANKADAIKTAKEAQEIWPQTGPYRAVQLFEHPPAQAGQSKPVAWRYQDARGHYRFRAYVPNFDAEYAILKPVPLYTHPAPVRQPISDFDAADSFMTEPHTDDVFAAYQQGIRFAERHHGITAQKGRT